MKTVEIKGGEELSDFTVEIDILSECQHPNIVKLLEAFFFQENLFVSWPFCSCVVIVLQSAVLYLCICVDCVFGVFTS